MPKLLVIHGVGFFDSEEVLKGIGTFAPSFKLKPEDVAPFNWDQRVDRVFGRRGDLKLSVLSRMSEGSLRAANLGFSSDSSYVGIAPFWLRLCDIGMLLIQTTALFWMPLLVCSFFLRDAGDAVALIVAALFVCSTCTVGSSKKSRAALRAVTRRVFLTCTWPALYCLGASITVLVMLIVLAGALFLLDYLDTHMRLLDQSVLMNSVVYGTVRVLATLFGFAVGMVVQRIAEPILKVISDVLRYIGLKDYRNRLLQEFRDCLLLYEQDCEHLIIYAHSLGSVIAVDTLLRYPDCLKNIKRLDLITAGSPLKRLFAWGFPEIFASPSTIYGALAAMFVQFRWINIYRPLDVIGANISSPKDAIVDISTGELLKNHTNYWNDQKVVADIEDAIGRLPYSHEQNSGSVQNWPDQLIEPHYDLGRRIIWNRRDAAAATVMFTLLVVCALFLIRTFGRSLLWIWGIPEKAGEKLVDAIFCLAIIAGGIAALKWIKAFWVKIVRPFICSFYGTVSDANPSGIPSD